METFRYPKRFKTMTAVSAVVFSVMACGLLRLAEIGPIRHPELFAMIMLTLGVFITWCVAMYRRADDTATVDDSGIVYRVPGHVPVRLAWTEITRVRARDLLQRLGLIDASGTRRIVLAYQMQDFPRLRELIRQRTVPPPRPGPPQRVFTRSWWAVAILLHWPAVFVPVAWWFWRNGRPSAFAVVSAWILYGVGRTLFEPRRVRLLDDQVAIDYVAWTTRIAYAELAAVDIKELKDIPGGKETTGGVATVIVETTTGRTYALAGFQDGSLALFQALDQARHGGLSRV